MDARQFLAEFGHIANATGGVQRLREFILSMAFSGDLCENSKNDSKDLIKSIHHQVTSFNEVKKPKGKIKTHDSQKSYFEKHNIPKTWSWLSLSLAGHNWGGKKPDKKFSYIDVSSINNNAGTIRSDIQVIDPIKAPSRARKIVKSGTVIYSTVRPYLLNIAVVKNEPAHEYIASTAFAVINPWEGISASYLYHYFRSPLFINYAESVQIGMAYPAISDKLFFGAMFPLPPLEEQARIVAKVDELMALCDQLEEQQQQKRQLQNQLRQAILQAVAAATSPFELKQHWQRLQDNFEQLFAAPEDVKELRLVVKELAIKGHLSVNREFREDAAELLARIAKENQQLVVEGKIKRRFPLKPIDHNLAPFSLPNGWAWARFPELGIFGRGKSKHRPRNDPKLFSPGIYPLVQTGEVARARRYINKFHSKYSEFGLEQSKLWPKNTLCITIAANIADSAILNFDACFPDSVVGFQLASEIKEEVEYFLMFMETAKAKLLEFAPSTAQKNINLQILESVLIPIPPKEEIKNIVSIIERYDQRCDALENKLRKCISTAELLAISVVSTLTGINIPQEEAPLKAPQTELVAPVTLGTEKPNRKDVAPLAELLTRHNGSMNANDLWQRFGGEIDAFYAQLKTEVAHDWLTEPAAAEMLEKEVS